MVFDFICFSGFLIYFEFWIFLFFIFKHNKFTHKTILDCKKYGLKKPPGKKGKPPTTGKKGKKRQALMVPLNPTPTKRIKQEEDEDDVEKTTPPKSKKKSKKKKSGGTKRKKDQTATGNRNKKRKVPTGLFVLNVLF